MHMSAFNVTNLILSTTKYNHMDCR